MAAPAAAASIFRSTAGGHGDADEAVQLSTAEQASVAAVTADHAAEAVPGQAHSVPDSAGHLSEVSGMLDASRAADVTSTEAGAAASEQQLGASQLPEPSPAGDTALVLASSPPAPGHGTGVAAAVEQPTVDSQPPADVVPASAVARDGFSERPAGLPEADAPLAAASGPAAQQEAEAAAEAGTSTGSLVADVTEQQGELPEEAIVLSTDTARAEVDYGTAQV